MEAIVITWRELLVVVVLVLAVYIAELLLLMRSGSSSLHKPRWLALIQGKQAEDALRSEQELRREIELLQQRLALIEARLLQPQSSVADADVSSSPYLRAIQSARQGHDAEYLASTCGISRGEAELLISMHGKAT